MSSAFKYRQQFYQDYFNSQSGRTFSLDLEAKIKSEEYLLAKEILPLMPKNHDAQSTPADECFLNVAPELFMPQPCRTYLRTTCIEPEPSLNNLQ